MDHSLVEKDGRWDTQLESQADTGPLGTVYYVPSGVYLYIMLRSFLMQGFS